MENLKISIITVCYNSAKTIKQTIESVLQQTYKNVEYIIIDGVSTDGTIEIVNEYLDNISIFISEPDNGIYDAMNKGIKVAGGQVVGILNSDDVFFNKEVLSKIARAFSVYNTDVVYGNIVMSKKENANNYVRKWIAGKRSSFTCGWHPPHPGLYIKRSAYKAYGLYNPRFDVSADFDLMMRFFVIYKVSSYYLNEFIVNMSLGGESTGSFEKILLGNINIRKSFKANNVTYLWIYPCFRIFKKILQFIKF